MAVPVGLSIEEARIMIVEDPERFRQLVCDSLRRQVVALAKLTERGMRFFDYGNAFLIEAHRAGAAVSADDGDTFIWPSYMQSFMGDIFSLGFGPFRWVCTSGAEADLRATDEIAAMVIRKLMVAAPPEASEQYADNLRWITQAFDHRLVVGSQARILYSNCEGRAALASAFNDAVAQGRLRAPVVISRDHHDVSGTDSPFRETSDVYDGSRFTADMAVQNALGDAARGATWVALHNGGGVGWGEVINGGFGLVLDGSDDASRRARCMLSWDVSNGIARRSWAGNKNARVTIEAEMRRQPGLKVTLPVSADATLIEQCSRQTSAVAKEVDGATRPLPQGHACDGRWSAPAGAESKRQKVTPRRLE